MKFRKKPVVIEAIQWDGTEPCETQITMFMNNTFRKNPKNCYELQIPTLEGLMNAKVGDYIIKGVNGEFYPCKPDIFEKTYEVVEENHPMEEQNISIIEVPTDTELLEFVMQQIDCTREELIEHKKEVEEEQK